MQKNSIKMLMAILLPCLLLMACSKDETKYYADAEDPGIAIFSESGNNLLTCFIDGKRWRTMSRTTSGFYYAGTSYEVQISKQHAGSLQDTLVINWTGYFTVDKNNQGNLILYLAVPQNFGYKNLAALQGQRLHIDSTNGFFSTSISGVNAGNVKGSGDIYFHTARFDSIAPGTYSGSMSGLFEADFSSFKITRGRFDHVITPEQVSF